MPIRNINWYGVVYDALLAVFTIGGAWLLPFDTPDKIQLEGVVVPIVAMTIIMFYQKFAKNANYFGYLYAFIFGIIVVVFAMALEPIWWEVTLLAIHGQGNEAARVLNSKPHANLVLGIGLFTIFACIAGSMRLVFICLVQNISSAINGVRLD